MSMRANRQFHLRLPGSGILGDLSTGYTCPPQCCSVRGGRRRKPAWLLSGTSLGCCLGVCQWDDWWSGAWKRNQIGGSSLMHCARWSLLKNEKSLKKKMKMVSLLILTVQQGLYCVFSWRERAVMKTKLQTALPESCNDCSTVFKTPGSRWRIFKWRVE